MRWWASTWRARQATTKRRACSRRSSCDPALLETLWHPQEKAQVQRMLAASAVGSPDSVREQLAALVAQTGADELIVAGAIFDHAARVASYERLAGI
jgi:alkanesulfonate monooxygenase SsuD/methylene tetrahydromethanopterin reductase-like flavin-dependent oxidoreductase (luciferase family)